MMLLEDLNKYRLILASTSPRRRYLLSQAGMKFETTDLHATEETFPDSLNKYEIPVYLAEKKSMAYNLNLEPFEILITADTIVWLEDQVVNKPVDRNDAIQILRKLSGKKHEVITGVFLRGSVKRRSFFVLTEVSFDKLEEDEIKFYVDKYKPYDKAGSYGIQEWIGYIGINGIKGSYFNVMGLPVQRLYKELKDFIEDK